MKNSILLLTILGSVFFSKAQQPVNPLQKIKSAAEKVSQDIKAVDPFEKSASVSQNDIVAGLKQALSIGTDQTAGRLSKADGFFLDPQIKILIPEEAKKVESTLRRLGKGKLVDNAILSMNRAAEDASKVVSQIFLNAILKMSFSDAMGILKGGDMAATQYLETTTSQPIKDSMMPVIKKSLDKVNATKYWKDMCTAYNLVSIKKINPDLNAYVTEKAMRALFLNIAVEEKKIRQNPEARVTDLLRKVFGNK